MRPIRLILAAVLTLAATLLLGAPTALADHTQISVFQDDEYLIDSPTATVEQTLAELQDLGVQQVRVNVEWAQLAPDPMSSTPPPGFNGADPADYPAVNWAPFDRLVGLAPLYGMTVDFNLTSPGPIWAMGKRPRTVDVAQHWYPNDADFFDFVYAIGTRYSGSADDQPRVSTWSVWNEPNQPGWLAPQWLEKRGQEVPQSPRIYRGLVNAAYYGLYFSGHAKDTILIGETAPEGFDSGGFYTAMTPLPFLRALYCVNAYYQPLRGDSATALDCPTKGPLKKFVQENPGLFSATGYAHHPYFFRHPPSYGGGDPNWIPLADIGRLTTFLDRTFHTYGSNRQLPIYFTEYGYKTNPPDPHNNVSPAQQAVYLNEADYIAWRNPRVRSVAQFLLYDAAPNPKYKPTQFDYWDTFQTGLLYHNGDPKPALYAYQMPIWIPQTTVAHGQSTFVWGLVRPADLLTSQKVSIEWRPVEGNYETIATARTTSYTGYLTANVRLPGTGYVKLAWNSGTATLHSRAVAVTVR